MPQPSFSELPSRTSLLVAAGRAMGAREPDPAMRNPDWLAEKLLGPAELALIQEHPIGSALAGQPHTGEAVTSAAAGFNPSAQAAGTAVMMLIRTKYIDEKLQQAIAAGAKQFVILGAGFDTRAYRFADQLKERKVFEVDTAATQSYKRKRAEAAIGPPPANLTYVTIDFNRDNLAEALARAGYDPRLKTFFTWEGVSMYVAESGVRETLRAIAQAAPGSTLVMDFTAQGAIDFMTRFPQIGPLKLLSAWGEPWVFGMPDGGEVEYFEGLGLEPQELLPLFSKEAIERYLTRADGTVFGMPTAQARPQLSPEAQEASAAFLKSGASFYSLAELTVPEPA